MKFETFVEKMRNNYMGYVCVRVKDPDIANQIINDSLIKMYDVYHKIDTTKTKMNSYYFTVLNNVIIDYYRKNKSNLIYSTIDNDEQCAMLTSKTYNADYKLNNDHKRNVILNSIKKLKPKQQTIIRLIYIEGYTNKDVAKILDIPQQTVALILLRAKNKLKQDRTLTTLVT